MPNTALDEAIREAYATAPSNVVTLETLEISHPEGGETIYLVKNRTDLELTLETGEKKLFEGVGFRMTLPASGDDGLQELSIAIDNVDRRVTDFLQSVKNSKRPVELRYRPYLSNDLTKPQLNPPLVLFLRDISATVFEVSGKATFADIINKKFPNEIYTRSRFPSLGS